MINFDDITTLDDSALLDWRARARAELEHLPPASPGHFALSAVYDLSTAEVTERAREAWSHQGQPAGGQSVVEGPLQEGQVERS